ncbi:MAG: CopG family transcriptional regulator [Verrucomicrobiota bacterium]
MDIDDDMLQAAKELAQREGGTAGHIISSLARRGLADSAAKSTKISGSRGGVPLLPSRGEVVTLEHVQSLI